MEILLHVAEGVKKVRYKSCQKDARPRIVCLGDILKGIISSISFEPKNEHLFQKLQHYFVQSECYNFTYGLEFLLFHLGCQTAF